MLFEQGNAKAFMERRDVMDVVLSQLVARVRLHLVLGRQAADPRRPPTVPEPVSADAG